VSQYKNFLVKKNGKNQRELQALENPYYDDRHVIVLFGGGVRR